MNDFVGTDMIFRSLSSQDSFYIFNDSFCWDEGTEYEVTLGHRVDVPRDITFELDSVSSI